MTTNYKKIMMTGIALGLMTAPMAAQAEIDAQVQGAMERARAAMQQVDSQQIEAAMKRAQAAMQQVDSQQIRDAMEQAQKAMKDFDSEAVRKQMDDLGVQLRDLDVSPALARVKGALGGVSGGVLAGIPGGILGGVPGFAFAPQASQADRERIQEQMDRAREAADRVREARDRVRESEDRNISWYRDGTSSIDEHKYERAIEYFDRVINAKWSRADGAYYWKAYALNKLGKRDDALAALAEIPKQFPQSRWVNDAKALQVEIQQATGQPVSPEGITDEDLKLLALQSIMSSDAERAVPLAEKVINDPKNNLGLKGRALYLLAQSRSDKAREIVAAYAKNGSNQDLQIRAVGYVGSFRMANSPQILADVYSSTNDVAVRRAVLRGMANARDASHLLNAAKNEQNADLRREAIRGLGNMQAVNELAQLYPTETSAELKQAIIDSIANGRGIDKLIDLARTEKDATLRAYSIRRLGFMRNSQTGGEKASEALATIYKSESDKAVKSNILRALWQSGACQQLVDAARAEKDTDLKAEAVRDLGQMRGCKEASDYLMELIAK